MVTSLQSSFEVVPIWIFAVEFGTVVRQEQQAEDCKEDAPEGTPHGDVVDEGGAIDPVDDLGGGELHVEGDGVTVTRIIVHE